MHLTTHVLLLSQCGVSVLSACGRSEVHRPTHPGQRICASDRKGMFFFKSKSIQSAQLFYWHWCTSSLMSLLSLPPLERLGLARLRKQDFSQIVQCWPLPATQNAVFAFSNTTVSKGNLETKSHLGSWWKITDYSRASLPKAPLCFLLGWKEVRVLQAGLSDWPFSHWPAAVPQEQPHHHLPCSKGWGIFLTQIPTIWYLHLLSHIHLPPELMEWVGTSGKKITWPTAEASLRMRSVSLPGSCKGHLASHQLSLSTYILRNSIPGECSDAEWLQQRKSAVVLHTQLALCASFSSCPPVWPCSELHFMTEPSTGNLLVLLHLQKQQEHEDHHMHGRCCSSTKAWHRTVSQAPSGRDINPNRDLCK